MAKDYMRHEFSQSSREGYLEKRVRTLLRCVESSDMGIVLGNSSGPTTHIHQNRDDGFRIDDFSAVDPLQRLR